MTGEPGDDDDRDVRYWPRGTRYPDADLVDARCGGCGALWRAHRDIAGSRIVCDCGARVGFSATLPVVAADAFLAYENSASGAFGSLRYEPRALPDDLTTSAHLEPGALIESGPRLRARWTNRMIAELVLVMCAFVGPGLALQALASGKQAALYSPLAGLAASVLVLAIAATARHYALEGLRPARVPRIVEGIAIGLVFAGVAVVYARFLETAMDGVDLRDFRELRDVLGTGMSLFTIAFLPAVFEELAFRGLLQGRTAALFGNKQGVFIASVTFGLAHGLSLGLPFQVGVGLYLGWLKLRGGSLYPCMLLHFFYNATIVLAL